MNFMRTLMILFSMVSTSSASDKELPDHIMNRLRNVKDFSSLITEFKIPTGLLGRNRPGDNEVTLENEACKPRPVVVEVPQPPNSNSFHYPYFVQVHRCSGSCGASHFTSKCVGKSFKKIRAKVVKITWSTGALGEEIPPALEHVEILNETECACTCKHDGNVCNRYQYWDDSSCKCRCNNWGCPNNFISHPENCCECNSKRVCTKKKVWDKEKCACVCKRRNKRCKGTNKVRDPQTCKCVCPPFLSCRSGYAMNSKTCSCNIKIVNS